VPTSASPFTTQFPGVVAMRVLLQGRLWGAVLGVSSLVACGPEAGLPGGGWEAEDGAGVVPDVQEALAAIPGAKVGGAERGLPYFVRGAFGQLPAAALAELAAGAGSGAHLRPALEGVAPLFRLDASQLSLLRVRTDEQGHRHLRFGQLQDGLPVIGAELVMHVDAGGRVYAVNGSARGAHAASPVPFLSPADAQGAALRGTDAFPAAAADAPRLVYLPAEKGALLELAWQVRVLGDRAGLPVDDLVYVHAHKGGVLAVHPQVHTALNRRVHSANNGSSLPGTLRRAEGAAATGDAHVDDNYAHLGTTYDCYQQVFGRDSYNGAGAALTSTVHYSTNYVNAFWNGSQMVYGDGNGTQSGPLGRDLDVTVHELTHAVTDTDSDLIYSNESGALNEGQSDIMAAFCESWTRSWSTDADVWKIGEDIWTPATAGDALRYMANPTQDGSSTDYYPERYQGSQDSGGVHWNSGIANLAFKLLSTGGTHPRGKTAVNVAGIGVEKAGRIFYKANRDLYTASTTFAQAKTYTEQAAQQLGYDAATVASVTQAWAAVGVGGTVTPPPTSTTPLSNGVALTGRSGAAGSATYYSIAVPAGQSTLVVETSGGTGDADLYVRVGSNPTTTTYTCKSDGSTSTERCSLSAPAAGTYYILLQGYSAYSGVSLKATHSTSTTPTYPVLADAVPVSNVSGASGSSQYWQMQVPAGVASLTIATSGGTGDADLYVRQGAVPTTSTYGCRPYRSGNAETCTFSSPAAGTWYVMLRGYSAYSGVTLRGDY
jgi:vibriolysin